jgi:hypothetical protein
VVQEEVNNTMDRLKRAKGQEAIYESAIELKTGENLVDLIKNTPKWCLEDLRKEGDSIYG